MQSSPLPVSMEEEEREKKKKNEALQKDHLGFVFAFRMQFISLPRCQQPRIDYSRF